MGFVSGFTTFHIPVDDQLKMVNSGSDRGKAREHPWQSHTQVAPDNYQRKAKMRN
jgi:hypothetical protein